MPYYPLGYPTPEASLDVIEALARGGADAIEVGVPFSDPLADGPVIQRATQAALQQGMTLARALAGVSELRARGVGVPLVLMGYYNPLLAFGLERLAREAAQAGVSGFIVPDLPAEEAGDLEAALDAARPSVAGRGVQLNARTPGALTSNVRTPDVPAQFDARTQFGGPARDAGPRAAPAAPRASIFEAAAPAGRMHLIRMLAPTTPPGRARRIVQGAGGFLYLVSLTGVTGARDVLPPGLPDFIARVRAIAPPGLPLCVGFGISTPEQARAVGQIADGVIVGSACVKAVGEAADPAAAAEVFARRFSQALRA
jgi:tryptophan synthase alpha chain